jgi:5-methylcytosine-specific restriction enzyme A
VPSDPRPWAGSTRKKRLPPDWQKRRLRVLRRDGYRCQHVDEVGAKCLAPANQVDHVIRGDDHDESNLRALCKWHHDKKSSAEGLAAKKPPTVRQRALERRPGIIYEGGESL